jgi:Flp pilus assembly protein TadG
MWIRSTRRRQGRPQSRREGAAALDFALVATPFFFLLFAVMELALIFVLDSVLENATLNASRLVRTGQADTEGITAAAFEAALCGQMGVMSANCAARTDIDVRVVPQFRAAPPPDPLVDGEMDEDALTYLPGDPGSLVLVRVWYSQPLVTPFLARAVSRLNSGDAVLSVATAFRNEPYDG